MSNPELNQGSSKITSEHTGRLACVYVRQSTMQQVEHHRESQANQYRLVDRAHALGWSEARIRVIDSDQGKSGKDSRNREGFNELLAEVSLSHVGIILGYEVSRLARNNSDWYRLLDLAAVFGTLIADSDGVYDPRLYNDRLLLGLKGTMSEAELHILRLRLSAGRLSKVKSGTYRQCLPTGYVWLDAETVVQDPDEQVRHVLEMVFAKFDELGSCHGVFRYLRCKQILLPRRPAGIDQAPVSWKMASITAVTDILTNPAYAGAFVYGRQRVDPTRKKPEHSAMPRTEQPMDEWLYVRQDAYPAYLSWEHYLANQERIHTNGTRYMALRQQAAGAVREGNGLLQGLAVCGHCGRRMYTNYKPRPIYACAQQRHEQHSMCCIVNGVAADQAVIQAFFQAIRPAELDALEQVLAAQQADHDRLAQHWQDELRRAHYEAHLAERQYNAVDPDNRLVASTLERRWEEKLEQLRETEEAQQRFVRGTAQPALSPELCEQFRHISAELPRLWQNGQVTHPQQKALLRALIGSVILTRVAPDQAEIKIVWVSGHYSVVHARLPVARDTNLTSAAAMAERIHVLYEQGMTDEQMAQVLTQEGFHSARKPYVSTSKVYKVRLQNRWLNLGEVHRQASKVDGYWTSHGLAVELGVEVRVILKRIYRHVIPREHVHRHEVSGVYLIDDYPELLDSLRQTLPG